MGEIEDLNTDGEGVNTYKVTPELAHMLENMPLDELRNLYDDGSLVVARFVEGRERQELNPPTDAELDKIYEWWATTVVNLELINLVLKGLLYVDLNSNGEPVFSISFKGRDALETINSILGLDFFNFPEPPTP
jgi:hypothetical protein